MPRPAPRRLRPVLLAPHRSRSSWCRTTRSAPRACPRSSRPARSTSSTVATATARPWRSRSPICETPLRPRRPRCASPRGAALKSSGLKLAGVAAGAWACGAFAVHAAPALGGRVADRRAPHARARRRRPPGHVALDVRRRSRSRLDARVPRGARRRSAGTPRSSCSVRWSAAGAGVVPRGRRRPATRSRCTATCTATCCAARPARTADDIATCRTTAIAAATGAEPQWFRPPFGILSYSSLRAARPSRHDAPCCGPRGAATGGARRRRQSVVADVTRRYVDGGTVLLHDSDCTSYPGSWRSALGALPRLADEFGARGLTVGPVGEHGLVSRDPLSFGARSGLEVEHRVGERVELVVPRLDRLHREPAPASRSRPRGTPRGRRGARRARRRSRRRRSTPRQLRRAAARRRSGMSVPGVEHHRAEVLGVDRAPGVGGGLRRRSRDPRATSPGVQKLGSQPSAKRPTRRSSAGARPPSHTSSGCCTGRVPIDTPS